MNVTNGNETSVSALWSTGAMVGYSFAIAYASGFIILIALLIYVAFSALVRQHFGNSTSTGILVKFGLGSGCAVLQFAVMLTTALVIFLIPDKVNEDKSSYSVWISICLYAQLPVFCLFTLCMCCYLMVEGKHDDD
jgi:hypothetical protein